jgi:hypothetical protein
MPGGAVLMIRILEDSGTRCSVDTVTNEQGEMLVECMKSVDLCFVNSAKRR